MREVIESTSDIRKIAEELISVLESDAHLTEKAKNFEKIIQLATPDVKSALELFDLPDLKRHEVEWPANEVQAAREHAKECDVCAGDVLDQPEEFGEAANECLNKLKKLKNLDFPSSSDRLMANYSKGPKAFSAIIEVSLSGPEVICYHEDLKNIIQAELKKIPTNQTSRNFLFCAVKALPLEYREYKLVL